MSVAHAAASPPAALVLRPARVLLHPLWLGALLLLALNDHVLKGSGQLPGWLTGKLSDLAGMLVAPALVAIVVRARTRRRFALCHVLVGAGFAAIKISPAAARAVELASATLGVPSRIWVDPTDLLVAVPALAAGYRVFARAVGAHAKPLRGARRLGELGAALVGLVACLGTSPPRPELVPGIGATPIDEPLVPLPSPLTPFALTALEGHEWRADSSPRAFRFEGGRYVHTTAAGETETGVADLALEGGPRSGTLWLRDRKVGSERAPDRSAKFTIPPEEEYFELDGVVYRAVRPAVRP